MSKYLFIVRHAKTEEIQMGQNDFDRELRPRGYSDAKLMAQALITLGHRPDKIYSSHAMRTKQTVKVFCEELPFNLSEVIYESAIYEASLHALLNVVVDFDEQAERVFLIGHNPGLCMLADFLTGADIYSLPTSGVVCIRFEINTWEEVSKGLGHLEWLKTPKML